MIVDCYLDSEEEINPKEAPKYIKQKVCLGFRWTEEDEKAYERAKKATKEFMKTYGKGEKPQMIDLSHYLQCDARIDFLKKNKK